MPEWLNDLLEDEGWRKMIYRLSERYNDCVLLNEAIQVSHYSSFIHSLF
jgi:hypothetical protein